MTGHVTRLLMVGDWYASGRMPVEDECTAAALRLLRGADVAFANLETPLTTPGCCAREASALRADPALADDLVAAGADIVTLANNHMLDYGPEGLLDTLDALDARRVAYVGAGRSREHARAPHVLRGPGGSIGFFGFA